MSDTETKTDQANAARMQKLRAEFAMAWPEIYEQVRQIYNRPDHAPFHHCAWMAWRAAKATSPVSDGSALVDMAIADYVAVLERQNKYLRKELHKNEARLKWLHDVGPNDAEGFEWGIFRVKWENGRAVQVWQTLSDLSDLDAEMARSSWSRRTKEAEPPCE